MDLIIHLFLSSIIIRITRPLANANIVEVYRIMGRHLCNNLRTVFFGKRVVENRGCTKLHNGARPIRLRHYSLKYGN